MLPDGDCLYLEILKSGMKSWRMRYFTGGKETTLTLGRYPGLSLKEARSARNDMKKQTASGGPLKPKVEPKGATFAELFEEYLKNRVLPIREEARAIAVRRRMNNHALPRLGGIPADEIDEMVLLGVIRAIEAQGKYETAHIIRGTCGQVFRYGISAGKCKHDPSAALKDALHVRNTKHRARIQGKENIGALMRAIEGYGGHTVRYALMLQAYMFLRPRELASLEWNDISWGESLIRIPAGRMKMRREHIVPMSKQVAEILKELKNVSGHGKYIFTSRLSPKGDKHMSIETMLTALRRMGYAREEMTIHGFRGIAATELYESSLWSGDAIERQLAHVEGNSVKAAYSYAQYLNERREMLQWWADFLDGLKGSAIYEKCS
jgi:integrase